MSAKSQKSIFALGLLSLLSMVPVYLSTFDFKVDIFVFYERERYLENIGYDVLQILTLIILTHQIYMLIPDLKYKRYAFDFFLVSLAGLPAYFLFYSQYVSLLFIPLLAGLLYKSYIKNGRHETGSNTR